MTNTLKIIFNFFIAIIYSFLIAETFLISLPKFLDSKLLLILTLTILIILRLKKIKFFNIKTSNFLLLISILLAGFNLFLMLLERQYGFQYLELTFSLSYSRLFYLVLVTSALAAYGQSFNLNKRNIKIALFILPLYLTLLSFFIHLRNNQLFRLLIEDDHLIEYSQFFLFLLSSLICFFLRKFWWSKERFLGILFLFLAIGCFFVAGEEISWGQRLLNIETPEQLAERNTQDELTIHNIDVLFGMVYRVYMIIGLLGSTAWMFFKLLKKQFSTKISRILSNLIPDWYLSPYFAVAFFYNYERFYLNPRAGETLWEEPMEFLLILGITVFLLIKYLRVYPKGKLFKSFF
ncbi:MAG: hypothetical protein WCR60_01750 [Patescibacteria group bacterium]